MLLRNTLIGTTMLTLAATDKTNGKNGKNGKPGNVPITNAFYDMDNKPVKGRDNIVSAYTALLNAHYESEESEDESELTPEQVFEIVKNIKNVPKNDEEINALQELRLKALIAADKKKPLEDQQRSTSATQADAHYPEAIKFGEMLTDDVVGLLEKVADDKENVDGAPIIAEAALTKIYVELNPDGTVKVDHILQMPIPDSTAEDIPDDSNAEPDKYTDDDDKARSYFGDLYDASKKGRYYIAIQDQLAAMAKNQVIPEDALIPELANIQGERAIQAAQGKYTGRRRTSLEKFKRAIRFHQQKSDLEALPKVAWSFANTYEDSEGNVHVDMVAASKMPRPFVMRSTVTGATEKPISLQTFNNLRVDIAKEQGGTVAALMKTVGRKSKSSTGQQDNKEGDKQKLLLNVKQFDAVLSALYMTLKEEPFLVDLRRWVASGTKNGDVNVKSLYFTAKELWAQAQVYETRIENLLEKEKELEVEQAKAEAEKRKQKQAPAQAPATN